MSNAAIELRGVSRHYSGADHPAVEDLSLQVMPGEIVALLGPSGCGKTTTLRMIAGFEHADAGAVAIAGELVDAPGTWLPPEKRKVGMVFQDYALFPHLTVRENILFGLRRTPRANKATRLAELLELTGLQQVEQRYPHQLSGGQQQRVALARALAPHPRVLLLDEPFSNLDTELRTQMRAEVREIIKRTGTTAVLVTHDQQEAMTVADRMAVMLGGRIEQVDTPEFVYHYPATRAVAAFVGAGTFVPATLNASVAQSDIGRFNLEAEHVPPQVDLLLRPRDVTLEPQPAGIATVLSRTFQGAEYLYIVQLPCGVQLQTNQPSHVEIAPGTAVNVRCNRARLAAYQDDARVGLTSAHASSVNTTVSAIPAGSPHPLSSEQVYAEHVHGLEGVSVERIAQAGVRHHQP